MSPSHGALAASLGLTQLAALGLAIAQLAVIWSTLWQGSSWEWTWWPWGNRYGYYYNGSQCLMEPPGSR